MSLRSVHIVFITLATLLSAWAGVWCVFSSAGIEGGFQAMGIGLLALALGLIGYGVWFVRKTRGMS